jgi:hypothetical protein
MMPFGQTACPDCGGPLPAAAPGSTVVCVYCRRSLYVAGAPGSSGGASAPLAAKGHDPLGNLVVEGTWQSIIEGHELVPLLGRDRWIDWEPASGAFHVWAYDRSIASGDPLPSEVAAGSWASIRAGHELLSLGGDHVLDWEPASGRYRVWSYDASATGSGDILPTTVCEGSWQSIRAPSRLIYLGGDRLLEWDPTSGGYRIWAYDRAANGRDPLPGAPIAEGAWGSIRSGHELVYCDGDLLLDWVPSTGDFHVWSYDRSAQGQTDPLPTELAAGNWESIREGHRLIHLEGDRVLDWERRSGAFRVWALVR